MREIPEERLSKPEGIGEREPWLRAFDALHIARLPALVEEALVGRTDEGSREPLTGRVLSQFFPSPGELGPK